MSFYFSARPVPNERYRSLLFTTIMTSVPSATTWGSPTATKHALLIHGLTSSSHTWHRVASSLAAQGKTHRCTGSRCLRLSGYFVTAPDLVGHGSRVSPDYHLSTIVQDLRPYLEARNYSLVIGHSLGACLALSLFSHLPASHPTAILLIDPAMKLSPELLDLVAEKSAHNCTDIKPAEAHMAENPLWTREDGISTELGTRLCSVDAIHRIMKVGGLWCYLFPVGLVLIRIGFLPTAKPAVGLFPLLGRGTGEVESDGRGCGSCDRRGQAFPHPRFLSLSSRSTFHGSRREALDPERVSGSHRRGSIEEGS